MDKQAKAVCKSAFFHLRNIAKIRNYISFTHCKILIHAFITSKLDYYNSLLSGLRQDHINKLQLVQNSAARLLTGTREHEHISPILRSLHWLKIPEKIDFKLLLLTFKSLNDVAPPYMEETLVFYRPTRTLRSADKGVLVQTKYNLTTYGYRAFSHAAHKIWNSMAVSIRTCCELGSFKSKKFFNFKRAFQL